MRNSPVVLIVEDEPLTLLDAVALVTEAGFETIQAKNCDDAISIFESRADIRVIFTDINMTGSMDGLDLAHAVRDRSPPIEIIVTSACNLGGEQRLPFSSGQSTFVDCHLQVPPRGTPPLRCGRKAMQSSSAAILLSAKVAAGYQGGDYESPVAMSQYELARCTKAELSLVLNQIVGELPHPAEGSIHTRNAHLNLQNILRTLARPDFRPC